MDLRVMAVGSEAEEEVEVELVEFAISGIRGRSE